MVQPNTAAIGFCNWMLNISHQKLSGPQRLIVQQVYDAAVGVYSISDQTWYNFNLFSAWRNKYYLVYRDYIIATPNPAALYYAQFTSPPSALFRSAVDDFVQGSINDANFYIHDRLYLRATETEQQASLSMINPGTTPSSFNGSYIFTPSLGITGDALTAYIDNHFIISTQAVNYSIQSACFWFYGAIEVNGSKCAMGILNTSNHSYVYPNVGGGLYSYINFAGQNAISSPGTQGLTAVVIESNGQVSIWHNGVRINSALDVGTALPDITWVELALNSAGVITSFSDLTICMSGIASGAVDQVKLYARVQQLASTLGFAV